MTRALRSKTILFNLVMGAVEFAHGSMQLLQPLLDQETFILTSFALGMVHTVGGLYLRTITTQPLSEK